MLESLTNRTTAGNRVYVDLIYRETSLYATYWPFQANKVEVGDFGGLDKETGEFVYHGSVYKDEGVLSKVPRLSEEVHQPMQGVTIDDWIISARVSQQMNVLFSPQANIAGILNASTDLEFTFKDGEQGAFLVMKKPRMTELPKETLRSLSSVSELRRPSIYLVTKVVSCPAYALEVSDRNGKRARVRFCGQLPIPSAPGVTAGAAIGFGWQCEYAGSSHQDACNWSGEDVYCPLYRLQKVRRRQRFEWSFRGGKVTSRLPDIDQRADSTNNTGRVNSGDDPEDNSGWTDVLPPWDFLDEDEDESIAYSDDEL